MNKKTFLAALLAVCLMLTLAACGGSEPAEQAQPSGDTTATTAPSTEAPVTTPTAPTPADGEVLYTVKVLDTDGNAKANVAVNMCNDEGCMFTVSDAAGVAYFCKPEGEWKIAFSEQPEIYYYFETGSREMTLVYDLAAAAPTDTEPTTNDVEFGDWG